VKKGTVKLLVFCLVVLTACVFATPGGAAAAVTDKPDLTSAGETTGYAPDEVIVKFVPAMAEKDKEFLKNQSGIQTVKKLSFIGAELTKIKNGAKVKDVVARLKKNPNVIYAEPNYLYQAAAAVNDPLFDRLWGMHNTGQVINGVPGTPDIDIDAPEAWDITMGSPDIIVAVIDTGTDISHPDLAGNIWTNTKEIPGDGIDNDVNGLIDDVNGWDFYNNDNTVFDAKDGDSHGTHVSGTVAAIAGNAAGVAGVAPGVKIMPLKFIGPKGGYTSDAILALGYAKKMGAGLASNSWGSSYYSSALKDAINVFGEVFVAAAGNDGRNTDVSPFYPASYDCLNIISVAAVNSQGGLASFSNYGTATVDVGAPGVDILSTVPGSSYQYMSGTSMATPHVSGIAALILNVSPSLTPEQVASLLKQSAVVLPSLQGKTASGGMANAQAALFAATGPGPFVTGTDPVNGAIEVPPDKTITVSFSENIVEGANFSGISLTAGIATVEAARTISGSTLTIDPAGSLSNNTTYTVFIPAGAVANTAGKGMAADYTFSFNTPDTVAPTVSSTKPADGATGVSLNSPILVYFSENIEAGDNFNSITLNGAPVSNYKSAIDGNILGICTNGLSYGTVYTVFIPAGAVTDMAGNALANPYTFSFTTVKDTLPPVVSSTDPADKAADVPLDKTITVFFNEDVQQGTNFGEITLTTDSGTGQIPVAALVSLSGSVLTIDPVDSLSYSTVYTVFIPAGAVTDMAGNALANPYTFSFTTVKDTLPPVVSSTDPANNAVGVPVSKTIAVEFNEAVQPGSAYNDITLKKGKAKVAFTLIVSGDTLTIDPVSNLVKGSTYTVFIPAGAVTDMAGNPLANPYTFNFTTLKR